MTSLPEYVFEFDGVLFGLDQDVAVDDDGWDIGSDDITSQDAPNIFNDSVAFGTDSRAPAVWSWTSHTDKARFSDDMLEAIRALGNRWLDRKKRTTPGVAYPLRYSVGGRTRVVFGRPRAYSYTMDSGATRGLAVVQFDFQRSDVLFYGDDLNTASIPIDPQESTGIETPLTFPLTTLSTIDGPGGTIFTDGDEPAPFEVTFTAGTNTLTNPRISGAGWELQYEDGIAPGNSVTISTYPWGARATRNDGANVSGHLSASSRLSKARLDPDGETLSFDAIDSSGTGACQVSWRPAYLTI